MLIRCMGAGLGRKNMHFYFRDEKLKKSEESKILKAHQSNLYKGTFVLILTASDWDDYGFKTDFVAWLHNVKAGTKHGLGTLKVGYKDQPEESWTINNIKINNIITEKLDENFFSMFNSEDSYSAIFNCFEIEYDNLIKINNADLNVSKSDFVREKVYELLDGINDIVYTKRIEKDKSIIEENVFKHSFLRSTSIKTILNSYSDIVFEKKGETNFELNVKGLGFRSTKDLKPSNNIHALIGSNGCGKSYMLDSIVESYINNNDKRFEKLIIVSFSPFDKLSSYKKYLLDGGDLKINYIGIKDFYIHINNIEKKVFEKLKDGSEIKRDFIDSYYLAIRQNLDLVKYVFEEVKVSHPGSQLDLANLDEVLIFNNKEYGNDEKDNYSITTRDGIIKSLEKSIKKKNERDIIEENLSNIVIKNRTIEKFGELSSGYQMVAYTLFSLIAHLESGTIVLYDEPEVYLHPPLMLTYIKILREIFIRKNGMGVFATHSPIILQEIPKSCIKVIRRIKEDGGVSYSNLRPETYASSITNINNEIFKIETMNTGFYKDIIDECKRVDANLENKRLNNKDKINIVLRKFSNQVGDEGLSIIYDFFYKEEQ